MHNFRLLWIFLFHVVIYAKFELLFPSPEREQHPPHCECDNQNRHDLHTRLLKVCGQNERTGYENDGLERGNENGIVFRKK